jgi:cytochrome c biogenesis protein
MASKKNKNKKGHGAIKSVLQWLWRQFSSVRLAVILILVVTGLSLVGALLIQAPAEISGDPQAYSSWVNMVSANKMGGWAPVLSALRLFNVFRSPWFIIACVLLMINILICTLNRWNSIKSGIRGGSIKQEEVFYTSGDSCGRIDNIQLVSADVALLSEKILKGRGYRARIQSDNTFLYIAADRNRYFKLGTYLSHFSLILFVLAFAAGNYLGFREIKFSVAEGAFREVGHETGLSLQLVSFVDEYYDNGAPKDYRSEVILYEGAIPVKEATIQVNHPLVYKGVRFYQSYFGPAVKMQIRDENGQDIFSGNITMDDSFVIDGVQRYKGIIELDSLQDIGQVNLISPAINAVDDIIPAGFIGVDIRNKNNEQIDLKLVELGKSRVIAGMEFTYLGESSYSGFQVSHDPASTIIWIASALFIFGMFAVLYFPFRQVWVFSRPSGKESSSLFLCARSPRGFKSNSELNAIMDQIKKELTSHPAMDGKEDN